MAVRKLREFLDDNGVRYVTISHSRAYTAQEIAASAHIPGKELAKTVVVRIKGELALAVLPASYIINFDQFSDALGTKEVELADESDFEDLFPGCELGAIPPFGNLFGMAVFVAQSLREDEEIAFSAGSHTELIRMSYSDFERLANPVVIEFSIPEHT